ncbi:MAG TPA: SPOR domain-containing protein [bacterium]|nr:SPOR domain-containing protein [bacterium]
MCNKKSVILYSPLILIILFFLTPIAINPVTAQEFPLRTYTTEEQMVSLSQQTSYQDAINILSKVAIKDEGRAIVDMTKADGPIGVEIRSTYWKDAMKKIIDRRGFVYQKNPNYYQIVAAEGAQKEEEKKEEVQFNRHTREVKINAIFFQADRTKSRKAGINWSILQSEPGLTIRNLKAGFTFAGSEEQLEQGGQIGSIIHNTTSDDGQVDVEALLNAFENLNIGKIISKPSIKVVDGQKGNIQVGKRFAVTQKDYAGNTVSRFVNAGTILEVTPQIITDEGRTFIHLRIKAEKSSAQTGLDRPEISTQNAETDVLLLDGEQTVIGGLFTQEKQNTRNGIPFLKDLPWWVLGLRYLFGSDEVTTNRKELIIFIQVEMVKSLQQRIEEKKQNLLAMQRDNVINEFDNDVDALVDEDTDSQQQKKKASIIQRRKKTEQKAVEKPVPEENQKVEKEKPVTEIKPDKEPETEAIPEQKPEEEIQQKPPAQVEEQESEIKEQKTEQKNQKQAAPSREENETIDEEPITEEKPAEKTEAKVEKEADEEETDLEELDVIEETKKDKPEKIEKEAPQEKVEETQVEKKSEQTVEQKEPRFTIQIMETANYEKALIEASKLTVKGFTNHIDLRIKDGKSYYSIKSGKFHSYEDAARYIEKIKAQTSGMNPEIFKLR